MMTVTAIEPFGRHKSRIFLDEEFWCVMTDADLSASGLVPGVGLSAEEKSQITLEVLVPHAKRKAMDLLKAESRTTDELRKRLCLAGFPQEAVDAAVAYVSSFGYLNDAACAEAYAYSSKGRRSAREIRMKLEQRGISPEDAEKAMLSAEIDDDTLLKDLIRKRMRGSTQFADQKERGRMMNFLLRRGFQADRIHEALAGIRTADRSDEE